MKLFPQLALVSAIAISGNAMAMQALDDSALSAATGQDGITIAITPPAAGIIIESLVIHDGDGFQDTAGGFTQLEAGLAGAAGAIVVGAGATQLSVDTGGQDIVIDIDADGFGGTPVLNINVQLPTQLDITTGDIAVAVSNGVGNAVANEEVVIDSFDISLGGAQLNIQLGNEAQGAMIVASGSIAGGLTITDFSLNDAGGTVSGGGIHFGTINIKDAGGPDLTLDATIDADAAGLVITTGGPASDITLTNVRLGADTNAAIGDVEILGLDMAGTEIRISGH